MIVGIDLGTTNSLIGWFNAGKVEIIPNRLGKLLTPSVVSVDEKDQILIGETAKEYGFLNPDRTARVFKRTMGTDKIYHLGNHDFSSEELSSFVLRSLKDDAETYLQQPVDEAIISVPAYFNDNQRKATKKAGELAGLKVSRIISEPTASAIAYGIGEDNKMERCMIFDLGGGTFDVSILEYYKNIMEVHSIAGDNWLGGEDFTAAMMELFLQKANLDEKDIDLLTLNMIIKACEKGKCEISSRKNTVINCVINDKKYSENITIEEYKIICQPLLERLRKPIEKSLRDGMYTLDDIDRIILVGGASRLSIVRDYVKEITGIFADYYIDPDSSIAIGATIQAAMKVRDKAIEEVILTDVCPFTLGTEVVHDNGSFSQSGYFLPIIERNTVIPVSKKERVYTAKNNQKQVTINVLQGESRMARNNLLLGKIIMDVPEGPKGQEAIDITYTYDINSLLEVEVNVVSTGENKKIIIQNNGSDISTQEAEERFKLLNYLKQNPRQDEENLFAVYKGERLYEESFGKDRELIGKALAGFEEIMQKGNRLDIERARKRMLQLFDDMEYSGGGRGFEA